jgi:DNA-binding beta-propeller fold protein YncE
MKHASGWTLARTSKTLLTLVAAAIGAALMLGSSCNLTNKAPTVPVITGPSSGVVGVAVTFKATATDPDNDSIAFHLDWGDSSDVAWTTLIASGETTSVQHTFSDSGTYLVKAKAKDKKGKESEWFAGHPLSLLSAAPPYPDSVYDSVYLRNGGGACCMLSPDGSLLCVGTSSESDSVSVIRVSDRTLFRTIRVDTMIGAAVFSTDNQSVYASSWNSGAIYRVDVVNGRVVDTVSSIGVASALAATPDGSRLLVGVSQNLLVMRTDSLATLDSVRLPYNSECMALNRAGTKLYVGVLHGLCAVDVQGCSLRMFTQAVDMPMYMVLSPDEESLYVQNGADSGVAVLRTSDLAVTRRVHMGVLGASHMERTPDGAHLYIGRMGTRIYDTRTLLLADSIMLPHGGPLAVHPSGDSVYYAAGAKVYVIGRRH